MSLSSCWLVLARFLIMLWGYIHIIIPDDCTTLSFSTQEKSKIKRGINSFFQNRTSVIILFSSVCSSDSLPTPKFLVFRQLLHFFPAFYIIKNIKGTTAHQMVDLLVNGLEKPPLYRLSFGVIFLCVNYSATSY